MFENIIGNNENKKILSKSILTKSNLPASDYVINPYVGCPHGCKYCYAMFMKRFTRHQENWGEFIDIKKCDKKINLKMISGKNIFLSSVTDCYNDYINEKIKIWYLSQNKLDYYIGHFIFNTKNFIKRTLLSR